MDVPKALIDAGGWAFGAGVLATVISLLIRGEFVLKRELVKADERADRATEMLEQQAKIQKDMADDVNGLAAQVSSLVSVMGNILQVRWQSPPTPVEADPK